MEKNKPTVLVVDDSKVNRSILCRLLQNEYQVIQAVDGKQALEKTNECKETISAVLLDLFMPVMDGYTYLKKLKDTAFYGIPVIVTTGSDKKDSEKEAFNLGAWDFVSKPYDAQILKYRLQSAIARSESIALQKIKHISEHDSLTGLHNRVKFFEETKQMLVAYPEVKFAFVSFDTDRFSLINTFFRQQGR